MTGLIRSPLTLRGALVTIDATDPVTAVAFQYNPDEMTRTLLARTATSGAGTDLWGSRTRPRVLTCGVRRHARTR